MADLGTAYVDVKGNLSGLQKQVSDAFSTGRLSKLGQAGGQALGRGLEGAAKQSLSALRSEAGGTGEALAQIRSEASGVSGALSDVGGQASNTAGALGAIGSETSSATDALGGISSQATDAADGLGTVEGQSQATADSFGAIEQKTTDSTNALATVQAQADQTGNSMGRLKGQTDSASQASLRSGRANQRVGETFGHLNRRVGSLARGLIAVVAGYRAYSVAKNAVGVTSELAKSTLALNRATGLDVETSSKWVAIMKARGASTQTLSTSFTALSRSVVAANRGGEKQLQAFADLGLTQKDLNEGTQDFEGLLSKVSDGFGSLEGGVDRAATAQAIFGRGGRDLLAVMGAGNAALQEQLALADKYGVTFGGKSVKSIRDLIQAEKELKFAQLGLQVQFTQFLAPALTKGLQAVNDFAREVGVTLRDPRLSDDEKISKVGDIIADRLEDATPKIANAAGKIAPKAALGFVRGFANAGVWGQLAGAAFLVSKLVGWGTILRAGGKRTAAAFGSVFVPTMAAEGAAGGAAAGGSSGLLSKLGIFRSSGTKMGRAFGRAFVVGAVLGLAFIGYELGRELRKQLDKIKVKIRTTEIDPPGPSKLTGPTFQLPTGFSVETRAKGGPGKGRMALVGEKGPELVNLPVGSYVHSNPKSKQIAQQMGIPGFAKGGWVGKDWPEEWGGFDPMLGPGNAQVPRYAAGGRISKLGPPTPPELRGNPLNPLQRDAKKLKVLSTAYGPPWGGIQGTGKTATGIELRPARQAYIVAVDPSVIPLHSRLTAHPNPFKRTGTFGAEDTGGAIKGNRIDFYDWRGRATQKGWGKRLVEVAIRGKGKPELGPPGAPSGSKPSAQSYGYVYPLARRAKVIGTPYSGTHTLGNWQSDNAVDIAAPFGTVIQAVADGTIVKTGGSGSFGGRFGGRNLTLRSRNNEFYYAHLSKVNTRAGRQVNAAQSLGLSGSANGVNHLHFGQKAGSPLGIAGAPVGEPKGKTQIRGVTVQGKVTFGTLLDALRAKLESQLALAKLTPRLTDDVRGIKKLVAFFRGTLNIAKRNRNSEQITESATSLGQYRDELKETRQKIRDKNKVEEPERELFDIAGLTSIGSGPNAFQIGGLKGAIDRIELEKARAALTVAKDQDNDPPSDQASSLQDDIAASQKLASFWESLHNLVSGQRLSTKGTWMRQQDGTFKWKEGLTGPFDPTPAQTKALNRTKSQPERIALLQKFRDEAGTRWVEGTIKQKTEAATNLADARAELKKLQDDANQKPDTSERDSRISDLLRQQLSDTQKELAISRAQFPVFERFKNAAKFHDGGIVKGPVGSEVPAMLQPREGVFTPEQMQAMGGETVVTLVIEEGAGVDDEKMKAFVNGEVARMVRVAKSGGPAPGQKMSFPR